MADKQTKNILSQYYDNFEDFLLIAIQLAGSGPEVRLHHFGPALKQLNKPILVGNQLLKNWKLNAEQFKMIMQEQDLLTSNIEVEGVLIGIILFPNSEYEETFLKNLETDYSIVSVKKTDKKLSS